MRLRLQSYLRKSRHEIYYFRRAVPAAIVHRFATREIYVSLRTGCRREAEKRALPLYVKTQQLFESVRQVTKDEERGGTDGYTVFVKRKGGKISDVKIDATAEEADAVAKILKSLGNDEPSLPLPAEPGLRLSELFTKYCRAQTTWRPASRKSIEGDLRQVAQVAGDPPVSELTKASLARLQETLQALPAYINKNPKLKDKAVEEILALGLPPQSPGNVKKKWGHVSAAFDWGMARGLVKSNDAKAMRLKAAPVSYEKFSDDDLARLFESDDYKGGFDEAFKYWIPLIALFTGARLDEICQLRRSDVKTVDSVLCFHITEVENDPALTGVRSKRLKTGEGSARLVPVHSTLLKLGLDDFLRALDDEYCGRLFPELRDSVKVRTSARASEWFTKFRRSVGVGTPDKKSRKTFHSFRHSAISRMQAEGVPLEVREYLMGHRPSAKMNVAVYGGDYPTSMLQANIEKLRYTVSFQPYVSNEAQRVARKSATSGSKYSW